MRIGDRHVDISNRDKVFFPDAGLTKGDVIDYYERIADTMIPHMRRYAFSMERYPDGIEGDSFYQKDAPDYFPDWIATVTVPKDDGGSYEAPIVDNRASLIYLADQAVLTPHLYLWRVEDLQHPDRMIYDLDPPEGTEDFSASRQAALDLHGVLEDLDLMSWVMTSGSKGYHVIVPLQRGAEFEEVRQFAHDVALVLVRRDESAYTLQQRKKKRGDRVFLDVLRNSSGATAVAPYAIRARPGAPVAMPLDWAEVKNGVDPQAWNIENALDRVTAEEDPWEGMMRHARSLAPRHDELNAILDAEDRADEER